MGDVHEADCRCGFKAEVTVGGTRQHHREASYFPHHCSQCGLVNVNIAKVGLFTKAICPKCSSAKVQQYGKLPVSIPTGMPAILVRLWQGVSDQVSYRQTPASRPNRRALHWGKWQANIFDNLCPNCKQMTLEFEPVQSVSFG
jgi:hypothetical protein